MNKEKQIEELAIALSYGACKRCDCDAMGRFNCKLLYDAELLYNAGCRKQSVGEWIFVDGNVGYDEHKCSACGESIVFSFDEEKYRYCPNCGARMKGDE